MDRSCTSPLTEHQTVTMCQHLGLMLITIMYFRTYVPTPHLIHSSRLVLCERVSMQYFQDFFEEHTRHVSCCVHSVALLFHAQARLREVLLVLSLIYAAHPVVTRHPGSVEVQVD